MKNRGFTLIELALVLFVGGLVMSGLLNLLQTAIANRQTQIQEEAVETVKATAILTSINNRTVTGVCAGSGCGLIHALECPLPLGSCRVTQVTYAVPAAVAVTKDYWGNNLVYARVTASVTYTTPPATVIFTVTSRGADAVTSADDQVTSVNAGEFMARVSRMGF